MLLEFQYGKHMKNDEKYFMAIVWKSCEWDFQTISDVVS